MSIKAFICGHFYRKSDDPKENSTGLEIVRRIDNDKKGTDIFDDLEYEIIDQFDENKLTLENNYDYWFFAIVEADFVRIPAYWDSPEEWDTEYTVTELKSISDLENINFEN